MRDRLLARVPERHRPLASRFLAVLAVGFLLFELSRFAAVAPLLAPAWPIIVREYDKMTGGSLWVAILTLSISAIAFVVPMLAFVWGLRWTHRRLFHKGTRC